MIREYWRVTLLVVLLLGSTFAILGPAGASADGPTNIKYGLQLDGGTRIRASVVGVTAEDVAVTADNEQAIEQTVAQELDLDPIDVQARPATGTVEVYADVSTDAVGDALQAANVSAGTVRQGVTAQTRQTTVDTIRSKINAAGLSGGSVGEVSSGDEHFIVVEVPQQNASSVTQLITQRGVVNIVARYPVTENGTTTYAQETVLQQEDFRDIGTAQEFQTQTGVEYGVPASLTNDAAASFSEDMRQQGFTQEGVGSCNYQVDDSGAPDENATGYCLLTVRDGNVVYAASMGPTLADSINQGTFKEDGSFRLTTTSLSDARRLQVDIQAGALPAPLTQEDTFFIAPSLAEQFKLYSLITGLVAVFAVAGTVFIRYRRPEVALPMIVTALSEVVILLGFAAAIGLPLDLSHIAGFIAVIGTGVDDLVIIADEVMAEKVSSARVFQSRFRKAFWVIGAAAATTIIAMSPLAILSLGDLRGFAIITILGVLIGVLITRPAYGDILRQLVTER